VIKGYARVSTDGQDLATQYELLKAAGAELVFSEKQSGAKTDRAALARLMASLEPTPAMTSPATAAPAAPSAPSTAPVSNFPARGSGDLYAHKVPAAAMRESDAQWQARCIDHVDKDPITLVSTYRYKAGVADCP
jgi:Resolvase, N terminal domain